MIFPDPPSGVNPPRPSHQQSTSCPSCGGSAVAVRCDSGPHYAELVCTGCRRFLKFIPGPVELTGPPPAEILNRARAVSAARPSARLGGVSEAQVAWAVAVRSKMIREATDRSDFDRKVILSAIEDSTWFCSNGRKEHDGLCWPNIDQLSTGAHP